MLTGEGERNTAADKEAERSRTANRAESVESERGRGPTQALKPVLVTSRSASLLFCCHTPTREISGCCHAVCF